MPVYCRLMTLEDMPTLLNLFVRVRASIARVSTKVVYKAILSESIRAKNVLCLVAVLNNAIVGYVLAVKNWSRFKITFPLKHPAVGFSVIKERLKVRKVRAETAQPKRIDQNALDVPSPSTSEIKDNEPRWEDNIATFAKVIHIGVDESARSQGVGSALYAALVRYLAQENFRLLGALIDEGNLPSVRLHMRMGWTVTKRADGFFAFIKIPISGGHDG